MAALGIPMLSFSSKGADARDHERNVDRCSNGLNVEIALQGRLLLLPGKLLTRCCGAADGRPAGPPPPPPTTGQPKRTTALGYCSYAQ
ncbi:hypothetical protein O9K51_03196 [Purpureocillium lavendulum]|uniref:Uncharacterized protein n=1 Tax=Purpureocillium lavendulum TaxID=1247861 RepID=A0AB34G1D2_9HYPO|nr:hypothetical protein O9K51_03196 [Purpureocillium lavendulum]